jgi:nicotinamide-nucleotide amidase
MINERKISLIAQKLNNKKLKIATAESCTGGLISNTFTNISGSSNFFDRGIVSYSDDAKMQLLDVDEELLIKYGAVSRQVAESMAKGVRINSNVDIGISTTGIAGPTGATKEKPIGLVYIGISIKNFTRVEKFLFNGSRLENKEKTCKEALSMLLEELEKM